MGKTRIYELAKELGVENKIILDLCDQVGVEGKSSHSNSLSDDEAERIRRFIIRSAVSGKGQKDREVTKDGQRIAERRVGTVIRRRRKDEELEDAEDSLEQEASGEFEAIETESATQIDEPVEEALLAVDAISEEASQVMLEVVEQESEESVRLAPPSADQENIEELRRKHDVRAPKILGKISLPQERVVEKPAATATAAVSTTGVSGDDAGGRGGDDKRRIKGKKTKVAKDFEDDGFSKKGIRPKRKQILVKGDLLDYGNERTARRSKKDKKHKTREEQIAAGEIPAGKRVVKINGEITVGEFSKSIGVKGGEVLKHLMNLGMMTTINQLIDFETASLIAEEFGAECVNVAVNYDEMVLEQHAEDDPNDVVVRPPVVTVMGHVDHGKTSLLDAIRKTHVASGEAGGITQHIGAYTVTVPSGGKVTFLDTPGHEAFTQMRARGAQVTDIVILIVAADDGFMPQTIEAINHAKAANVPIIVAINKMDKPDANIDRVKAQMGDHGLVPEDWGGTTIVCPISAHTGQGLENLLENLALQSEVLELTANINRSAFGTVIESELDRGRGPVMTVLVKNGTLKKGDCFIAGPVFGRVRALIGDDGKPVESASPSTAVEVLGAASVPEAGDDFVVFADEARARAVSEERSMRKRMHELAERAGISSQKGAFTLERLSEMVSSGEVKELPIIVKADVQGSVEAVAAALERLGNDQVRINVIHKGVGGITENDVQLCSASKGIIAAFNIRAESRAAALAESEGINILYSRVIYELVDTVRSVMTGMLSPDYKEKTLGHAEVRQTFRVPKLGLIAGCYVLDGKIERGSKVRLLRDNSVLYEGDMASLRRFKDDVKEVNAGYECGIGIDGYQDIKDGDVIEVFKVEEVAAVLQPGASQ